MGLGKVSIPIVIALLLITSVVFAEDFDFQVSVSPTTINLENCQYAPTMIISARNPYAISPMDIFVNGQDVCRLESGQTSTCSYVLGTSYTPGTPSGQNTQALTVTGIGIQGSFDSGKTKSRSFNIIINHAPSSDENSAVSTLTSVRSKIEASTAKVQDLSTKGFDMSTAWSHLSTANSAYSQATSSFNSCSFESAKQYALQAQSSADQATSQAENTQQAQKTPLTGNLLENKQQSDQLLLGIGAVVVIIIIGLAVYFIRKRKK